MTVGMWGHAAAVGGRTDLLAQTITDIARLAAPDGRFWEVHHARTGAVDGGWQVGWQWVSEPDQTWSATAYLRLIHLGLLGVRYEPDGLWFAPHLPDGWGPVRLSGLDYRNMALDITLAGAGRRVTALTVDGRPGNLIPADLTGRHEVRIELV